MNVIERVKHIVSQFPRMTEITGGIHVDFTEDKPGNCGLYPTGDQLIREDILGNQERQSNFVLYANFQSLNDYERMANSTFLLELAYHLDKAANDQEIEATIDGQVMSGKIKKLSSANGMLYGYQESTLSGPVTYQLQIYAQYHLESEEF